MTNQQAPEALRCAEWLEHIAAGRDVVDIAHLAATSAAELRSLHALALELADQLNGKNERLAALVEAQQPAPSAAEHYDEVRATLTGLHALCENISAMERRVGPLGSHARGYTHKITAALRHLDALATAPTPQADSAPSAAGAVGEVPLPLLVRDIAADLGTTPIQVCTALAQLGFGGHSVNMAVTPRMAKSLRAHFASTTPQADSAPTSGNWVSADDVNRLVRELDVALNGKAGAAAQESLCDVVAQVRLEAAKRGQPLLAPQEDSQPAQVDAMADSQYLAGVSAGWNAANADNPNEALRKLHESRAGYLKPLRAARAPADRQPAPTVGTIAHVGTGKTTLTGAITSALRAVSTEADSVTAPAYSIDADPQGIRARVADAITGALAFGAQGANPPPTGHWLVPFWETAREEASRNRPVSSDTLYLLRRLLSNQHTLTSAEFREELTKIVGEATQAADSVLEDAARLAKIMQAIRDYHFALDNREHGGVAMARAWNAICDVLNMDWVQGAESAARKQGGKP